MAAIDFPSNPSVGQSLTHDARTWVWDGEVWENQSIRDFVRTVHDTAPVNPEVGDEWFNSANGRLYNYYDGYWIEIGASVQGPSGVVTASSPLSYDSENKALSIDLSNYKEEINQTLSSDTALVGGYRYFVDTSAARTLTLPASPAVGDEIQLFDATGTGSTNNVTINNNSNKINGTLDSAIIDIDGFATVFVYTGSTYGWRMI
jgi:hypothetical protein